MNKEQQQILGNIQLIEKNQGLLLEKIRSVQQELFQIYGQRHLLKQKMMHRQLEQVLQFMPGSFGHQALYLLYISTCLEMKIQLNPEDHPLLKKLLQWADVFPQLKEQKTLSLMQTVTPVQTLLSLNCFEEYITYINFIGSDLVKLIRKANKEEQMSDRINLKHIQSQDLITFLLNSIPKVLYNVILPVDVVPPQYRSGSMQILYRSTNIQYFVRSKQFYSTLIKILVKVLLKLQLTQSQQKQMMEVVFRYFYCYHHDKKYAATDIFIEAFNGIHQSVRFAMADQFTLFFRIVRKIGKGKFCDYLLDKSEWLRDIYHKVADGNFVGYAKQSLNPFSSLKVTQRVEIGSGKTQQRTFQILEDYSLFYFVIDIPMYDVTVRLNYLGDFNASTSVCIKLLSYQKQKGSLKANIMAAKKGIYQFQFDNSYSWMNKKVIRIEKVVLSPLEFSSSQTPSWIDSFYDNVTLNQLKDKEKRFVILRKQPPPPPKKEEESQHDGVGNITKIGTFFNLKIRRGHSMYEFQSESEQKLMKKFNQILELGGKIKWMVNGEPLQEPENLKNILRIPVEKEIDEKTSVSENNKQETNKSLKEKAEQIPLKKQQKKKEELQKQQVTEKKVEQNGTKEQNNENL